MTGSINFNAFKVGKLVYSAGNKFVLLSSRERTMPPSDLLLINSKRPGKTGNSYDFGIFHIEGSNFKEVQVKHKMGTIDLRASSGI